MKYEGALLPSLFLPPLTPGDVRPDFLMEGKGREERDIFLLPLLTAPLWRKVKLPPFLPPPPPNKLKPATKTLGATQLFVDVFFASLRNGSWLAKISHN